MQQKRPKAVKRQDSMQIKTYKQNGMCYENSYIKLVHKGMMKKFETYCWKEYEVGGKSDELIELGSIYSPTYILFADLAFQFLILLFFLTLNSCFSSYTFSHFVSFDLSLHSKF